jgi:hypothetical protein
MKCNPGRGAVRAEASAGEPEAGGSRWALLKGDEDRWGVIKEGLKIKVQEFLPDRNA